MATRGRLGKIVTILSDPTGGGETADELLADVDHLIEEGRFAEEDLRTAYDRVVSTLKQIVEVIHN